MFEFIEKLRKKSESTKKKIAFSVAFSLSGIIFVVWLSVIYSDFKQQQALDQKVISTGTSGESPIDNLSDTLSTGISTIGEQLQKMKAMVSSFQTDLTSQGTTTATTTTTTIDTSDDSKATYVLPDTIAN